LPLLEAPLFAAILLAQAVTIFVGGQQLRTNPGPIEQNGRVFVPMRSIFERLGASVVYSAGDINATKDSTTVALRIGSTSAVINGQPAILDVAPFIVGASTFVPLRFVAQSLGASVNYDSSTRIVAISPRGGQPYRPAPPPPGITMYGSQPTPNGSINNRYATVSAQFSRQVRPGTVRVWIDGADITSMSNVRAGGFSYTPSSAMNFGGHTIRVAGTGSDGSRFDRSWKFTVGGSTPPPSPITLTNVQPANGSTIVNRFATLSANFSRVIDAGSLRVYLDGVDRTNQCTVSANGFSYTPPAPLTPGPHTVRATFRGPGGTPFDRSWSFAVR
jgi:hypothetical protein